MIMYITNPEGTGQIMATSMLPDTPRIVDYDLIRSISNGRATLELTLANIANSEIVSGMNIIVKIDDFMEEFTVIDVTDKDDEITIYAEDGGLVLLNSVFEASEETSAHNAAYYLNKFITGSGIEIGFIGCPTYSRTLSWDGEGTGVERILSVANKFDCEMQLRTEFEGMMVKHRYIDLYPRIGSDQAVPMRVGYELESIERKETSEYAATSLLPIGNNSLKISGSYDDGDIYTDGNYLRSRNAYDHWSGYTFDRHITKVFSVNTDSVSELLSQGVKKLRSIERETKTYDVKLRSNVQSVGLGDAVAIYLPKRNETVTARIMQIEFTPNAISYTIEAEYE